MTKNFEGVNVKWTIKLRNLYGDEDSNMTEMKEKLSKKMINI